MSAVKSSNIIDTPLKTLFIRNIGKDVTKDELIDLLALYKTKEMKENTRIGIVHGKDQNSAIIEVLEDVHAQLLKLNGVKFKGHDIILSTNEDPAFDAPADMDMENGQETINDDQSSDDGEIEYLKIHTRLSEWTFFPITDT